MAQLDRLGVADNTIVIYSSDHGLLNGEYSTGGKGLLYDLVAKIPLIIYDPRESRGGENDNSTELVLSIDVPATILAYAGIPLPGSMEGRDLNSGEAGRDEIFLESLTVAEGNPFIEALRTQEWKYVRYMQPHGCPYTEEHLDFSGQDPIFEQLFHLTTDPAERANLVGVEEYTETLEQFRNRIKKRSTEMTSRGLQFKLDTPVEIRPESDVFCW